MPYVTSIERLAREEGHKEGRQEGVAEGLQIAILELLERKSQESAGQACAIDWLGPRGRSAQGAASGRE